MEALQKESKELKMEIDINRKKVVEKAKLQEEFNALCQTYEEENEVNLTI